MSPAIDELTATAFVRPNGSGSVTIGNRIQIVAEPSEDAARAAIMKAVLAHARTAGAPVILSAEDSAGTSRVMIHPDGSAKAVAPSEVVSTTAPVNRPTNARVVQPASARPMQPLSAAVESTRLVSRSRPSAHILRFSTGYSVTVTGSGLIGRRPVQDESDPRDHLVTINDESRSVSRTHLEFGHTAGQIWIQDRHSANGTTILRSTDRIECVPGRRYTLAPGNIVEIGDHTFTAIPHQLPSVTGDDE